MRDRIVAVLAMAVLVFIALNWSPRIRARQAVRGDGQGPSITREAAQQDQLIKALEDAHWEVRAKAAQQLESVPVGKIQPELRHKLIALLGDV